MHRRQAAEISQLRLCHWNVIGLALDQAGRRRSDAKFAQCESDHARRTALSKAKLAHMLNRAKFVIRPAASVMSKCACRSRDGRIVHIAQRFDLHGARFSLTKRGIQSFARKQDVDDLAMAIQCRFRRRHPARQQKVVAAAFVGFNLQDCATQTTEPMRLYQRMKICPSRRVAMQHVLEWMCQLSEWIFSPDIIDTKSPRFNPRSQAAFTSKKCPVPVFGTVSYDQLSRSAGDAVRFCRQASSDPRSLDVPQRKLADSGPWTLIEINRRCGIANPGTTIAPSRPPRAFHGFKPPRALPRLTPPVLYRG